MKTTFKFLLSAVLVVSLSSAYNNTVAQQSELSKYTSTSGITYTDIHNYLTERGYIVLNITQMSMGMDWRTATVKNGIRYTTIVHTNGTSIVGHDDNPM